MRLLPLLIGAAIALFGLALLARPSISREWRHPLGQPLPAYAVRFVGALLVAAGGMTLWLSLG